MKLQKVGVFVFGDIGRSPRMQNHAIQLSKTYEVQFFGYLQTTPKLAITSNQRIHLRDMSLQTISKLSKFSYYLYVLVRIIYQIVQILWMLMFKYRNLKFVLIQSPPCIPNLFAIWFASLFSQFKLYLDVHNYGYTILGLKLRNFLILKLAEKYQKFFARRCYRVFCVSQIMRKDLKDNWGVQAVVLYDRPVQNFVRVDSKLDQHAFFRKYNLERKSDQILCVSSTSWTKDQDFSILLRAVQKFEQSDVNVKLKVFITGKGPQKQHYLKIIQSKSPHWKKVQIHTLWLQADDYPLLLSLCDFGVCLHYSSSGLDLPMKIVDMFAAGIPVLAVSYPALEQLVIHGQNGYTFTNQDQLSQLMQSFCRDKQQLKKLKENVKRQREYTWKKQWQTKFNS